MIQQTPAEVLERYYALNASYGSPLVLHLSRRGFFSEVNVAMAAVIHALVERRRLIVTEDSFNDLSWTDVFENALPGADWPTIKAVPAHDRIGKVKTEPFIRFRQWVQDHTDRRLDIEALGLAGDPMQVKRQLCAVFCLPAAVIAAGVAARMQALGLREGRYLALHVRRGDKVLPRLREGRLRRPESEDVPLERCVDRLQALEPTVRDLFLMTDDARVVDELAALGRGLRVASLCLPDDLGHHQPSFNGAEPQAKRAAIRRLVTEVEIAARSAAFAGSYSSNIPRYIAAVHRNPAACVSTDARTDAWAV